jgi:hypothetical protein
LGITERPTNSSTGKALELGALLVEKVGIVAFIGYVCNGVGRVGFDPFIGSRGPAVLEFRVGLDSIWRMEKRSNLAKVNLAPTDVVDEPVGVGCYNRPRVVCCVVCMR